MARGQIVRVDADLKELGYAMGVVQGTINTVKTDRYISDVLEYVHARLANDFDDMADLVHAGGDEKGRAINHVYEWDSTGPGARLWRHRFSGKGRNREASWSWVASKKPIPSPEERAKNNRDPMSKVSAADRKELSKQRYIFHWKAPVMEYNIPVRIRPVNTKMLFIPTFKSDKGFVFKAEAVNNNPGGVEAGRFTALWTDWWGKQAGGSMDRAIVDGLERDIASVESGIRQGKRVRKQKFSVNALIDYEDGMAAGAAWTEDFLNAKHGKRYSVRFNEEQLGGGEGEY